MAEEGGVELGVHALGVVGPKAGVVYRAATGPQRPIDIELPAVTDMEDLGGRDPQSP